jgi:hypothetical protein
MLTTYLLPLTVTLANNRPVLSPERVPVLTSLQLCDSNKDMVLNPSWVLHSKINWPTDLGRNTTLTLT